MHKILKSFSNYLTKCEKLLWFISSMLIIISFFIFDRESYLPLAASLIGVTSLIFNAKGNPVGQFLIIIFGIIYAVISFTYSYYGEIITYLGMTGPMSVFALVSWLRNPNNGNRAEVKINSIKRKEIALMIILTAMVTAVFYFVLSAFHTANLIPSTISVTTSFLAVYLTFRSSAYFSLAYAAYDIVLIILWILATLSDVSNLSVVICFEMFLVNDIYGFINWSRMQDRQKTINNFTKSV